MFQFTHPVRGATQAEALMKDVAEVSIHAPREGCDIEPNWAGSLYLRFNSRTP